MAFGSCNRLVDVTCLAETAPNVSADIFGYASIKSATLHVPATAIESYKNTSPWKDFGSIVATDSAPSETGIVWYPRPTKAYQFYNLNGYKNPKPQKGIYIRNGKKIAIK